MPSELVRSPVRRTYKFMQTVEKRIGDAIIAEGRKNGLSLQDEIRQILGDWYKRHHLDS